MIWSIDSKRWQRNSARETYLQTKWKLQKGLKANFLAAKDRYIFFKKAKSLRSFGIFFFSTYWAIRYLRRRRILRINRRGNVCCVKVRIGREIEKLCVFKNDEEVIRMTLSGFLRRFFAAAQIRRRRLGNFTSCNNRFRCDSTSKKCMSNWQLRKVKLTNIWL